MQGEAIRIIITGGTFDKSSDALFNLGFALSAVQLLEPGTYVAMSGRIFSWDGVRKNREAGQFEALE